MACGPCSGVKQQEIVRAEQSYPVGGGYLLATYPNCTDWYTGPSEGRNIYVVARNTDFERIFSRTQLSEASQFSQQQQLAGLPAYLENLATAEICRQAVIDIYGR